MNLNNNDITESTIKKIEENIENKEEYEKEKQLEINKESLEPNNDMNEISNDINAINNDINNDINEINDVNNLIETDEKINDDKTNENCTNDNDSYIKNKNTYQDLLNIIISNLSIEEIKNNESEYKIIKLDNEQKMIIDNNKNIIFMPDLNDEDILLSISHNLLNTNTLKITLDGLLIDTENDIVINYLDFESKNDYIEFLLLITEYSKLMYQDNTLLINKPYFEYLKTIYINHKIFDKCLENKYKKIMYIKNTEDNDVEIIINIK